MIPFKTLRTLDNFAVIQPPCKRKIYFLSRWSVFILFFFFQFVSMLDGKLKHCCCRRQEIRCVLILFWSKTSFAELQGHWWGFISRNYVVWPTFLLMNVFIALKGSHFWFLFDFTAAGIVPCGGRKTSPRTSSIVQFIFYFGPLRSAIIFWEIRN